MVATLWADRAEPKDSVGGYWSDRALLRCLEGAARLVRRTEAGLRTLAMVVGPIELCAPKDLRWSPRFGPIGLSRRTAMVARADTMYVRPPPKGGGMWTVRDGAKGWHALGPGLE